MLASKLMNFYRAVVLGAIATGIAAEQPMTGNEHTETAMPQEIGTMTSDGFLVYSMNHCIITQTTNCEVSLSTGSPAVETTAIPPEGTDVPYPVPSGEPGEPGEPGQPGEPTDGEPGEGEPTGTGAEPTPTDATGPTTGDTTASETGDSPSPTEGEDGGTATDTAATGTATAGASGIDVFGAGVLGMAGVAAAYLV